MKSGLIIVLHHQGRLGFLIRLIFLAIVILAGLIGTWIWHPKDTGASQAIQTDTSAFGPAQRLYYLNTGYYYQGDETTSACDPGFHMASIWEIVDTTNLKYDHSRGFNHTDSGYGPPSWYAGWVRTGYLADSGTTAGKANCNAWSSISGGDYGTAVYLPEDWTTGGNLLGWKSYTTQCYNYISVWCVADTIGFRNYLPLLIK